MNVGTPQRSTRLSERKRKIAESALTPKGPEVRLRVGAEDDSGRPTGKEIWRAKVKPVAMSSPTVMTPKEEETGAVFPLRLVLRADKDPIPCLSKPGFADMGE